MNTVAVTKTSLAWTNPRRSRERVVSFESRRWRVPLESTKAKKFPAQRGVGHELAICCSRVGQGTVSPLAEGAGSATDTDCRHISEWQAISTFPCPCRCNIESRLGQHGMRGACATTRSAWGVLRITKRGPVNEITELHPRSDWTGCSNYSISTQTPTVSRSSKASHAKPQEQRRGVGSAHWR